MSFHEQLLKQSAEARQGLLATPIIQGCLRGEVSLPSYVAFLREAYHHVRHTVPLLQATQAALPPRHAWLRGPLDEYIEEEAGHDEWILNDIAACGADAEAVRHGDARPRHRGDGGLCLRHHRAAQPARLLRHGARAGRHQRVAGADGGRRNPGSRCGLPDAAFSYLRSHGTLDQSTPRTSRVLMDRIDDPQRPGRHRACGARLLPPLRRRLPQPAAAADRRRWRHEGGRRSRAADRRQRRHRPGDGRGPCATPARRSWAWAAARRGAGRHWPGIAPT